MKIETWYLLEDGNVADPRKCEPDKSGHLAHDGVRVKMRGDVYHSRSVDADKERKKAASKPPSNPPMSEEDVKAEMAKNPPKSPEEARAEMAKNPPKQGKDMKPEEPKTSYKTRESKAK